MEYSILLSGHIGELGHNADAKGASFHEVIVYVLLFERFTRLFRLMRSNNHGAFGYHTVRSLLWSRKIDRVRWADARRVRSSYISISTDWDTCECRTVSYLVAAM
jgi:hypothetical protein